MTATSRSFAQTLNIPGSRRKGCLMASDSHFSPALSIPILLTVLAASAPTCAQTTQLHVHHVGHEIMPFDLSTSVHIFKMTDAGGVEQVVLRDPKAVNPEQVSLIQHHLQHEASEFQRGNFGDPASLHGEAMPGLKELQANASKIKITYSELPSGAQINFETSDIHTSTAIHRWFGAQLSEHGADAISE
jgi:hypothetical protein